LLLFLGLALTLVWPLPTQLAGSLPLGTEEVGTVPQAMAWSFWWQADRLAHGLTGFWNAPIFHPTPGTFAFSEMNVLGGFLLAPVVWVTSSAALAHNLFLIICLALNGFSTARLLAAVGLQRSMALVGGIAVTLLPVPHQELGVLPLVPMFGVVWSLHALWRWTERPTWGRGLLCGLALACTYLLCFQYALFLAMLAVVPGLVFLRRDLVRPRPMATLALGALLAAGVTAPVVAGQLGELRAEQGFDRKEKKVVKLSCTPRHYLRTPWKQAIPTPGIGVAKDPGWKAFYPGTTRLALAIAGLIWALTVPRMRRWGLFLGAGVLVAYAMSLGPNLQLLGIKPWAVAAEMVPGYSKVRSLSRWAAFVQLFTFLLAAFGLQSLVDQLLGRPPQGSDGGESPARGRRWGTLYASLVVLSALAALEIVPPSQRLVDVPRVDDSLSWANWVRDETPASSVLAILPIGLGGKVEDYEVETTRMLLGARFERPMVNGYSSYFPEPFRTLKKKMKDFPDTTSVRALQDLGVTHVVVDQATFPEQMVLNYPAVAEALTTVFRDDEAGMTVYVLRPD
jgi:hypothetical protein